jgi:hypothetical protein
MASVLRISKPPQGEGGDLSSEPWEVHSAMRSVNSRRAIWNSANTN